MPYKSNSKLRQANQQRIFRGEISGRAILGDGIDINKYGELVVKVTFPMEEVEENGKDLIELRRLIGLPVTVTFKVWEGFDEFLRNGEFPDDGEETAEATA